MSSQRQRESAITWAARLARRVHLRATPASKVRALPDRLADDGPVSWSTMADDDYCTVPPAGWWCSREPGHDGPCAARTIGTPIDG